MNRVHLVGVRRPVAARGIMRGFVSTTALMHPTTDGQRSRTDTVGLRDNGMMIYLLWIESA